MWVTTQRVCRQPTAEQPYSVLQTNNIAMTVQRILQIVSHRVFIKWFVEAIGNNPVDSSFSLTSSGFTRVTAYIERFPTVNAQLSRYCFCNDVILFFMLASRQTVSSKSQNRFLHEVTLQFRKRTRKVLYQAKHQIR